MGDLVTGEQFAGWELVSLLGTGYTADVWLCRNKLGKRRAVKVFRSEFVKDHGEAELRRQFRAQLGLGQHDCPFLVRFYADESGNDQRFDGRLFLMMDYVEGSRLDVAVHRGAIPPARIRPLVAQIAQAAKYLEDKSIYHRDIKPENIIVSLDHSRATLLRFGCGAARRSEQHAVKRTSLPGDR